MIIKPYYVEDEQVKPLTEEVTKELFSKYYNGDMDARNILIQHNLRLVMERISKKFGNLRYDRDDLINYGVIGLTYAVDNFDLSQGTKFSTYVYTCIDNEIYNVCRQDKKNWGTLNFSDVISENEFGELEIIDDSLNLIDEEANFYEVEDASENKYIVFNLMEKLEKRDQMILKLYFGFYNDRTYNQEEISKLLGMSRSNVATRIIKALDFFRKELGLGNIGKKKRIQPKKITKTLG